MAFRFGDSKKTEENNPAGSAASGSEAPTTSRKKKFDDSIEQAHQAAVTAGEKTYRDPKTGYTVMTESFLKARGTCCQSGCRHCPYGFSF